LRLDGYDYATAGYYFITVCVQGKEPLLGEIVNGAVVLNKAGRMVDNVWAELPQRYPDVAIDTHVVMPNHFHGIIIIDDNRRGESCIRPELTGIGKINQGEHKVPGEHKVRPYGTLDGTVGRVIQAFKSLTTNAYIHGVKNHNWRPFPGKLWQRNYYERIIRNDEELDNVRQYIHDNPGKWASDTENPAHNAK
jgi:REP element-mobilizing transposase RayT